MALFTGSNLILPHSISANTTQALHRKILSEQARTGYEFKFISFYFDPVKKEHVGWYYAVKNEEQLFMEANYGNSKE